MGKCTDFCSPTIRIGSRKTTKPIELLVLLLLVADLLLLLIALLEIRLHAHGFQIFILFSLHLARFGSVIFRWNTPQNYFNFNRGVLLISRKSFELNKLKEKFEIPRISITANAFELNHFHRTNIY